MASSFPGMEAYLSLTHHIDYRLPPQAYLDSAEKSYIDLLREKDLRP